MGYSSSGVVAIKKKEVINFNMRLAQIEDIDYEDLLAFLSEALQTNLDPDEDRVVYEWRSIKWYSNCARFVAIEDALGELPSDSFAFIRIGEDIDDIYVLGDPCNLGIELIRDFKY